MTEPKISKTHRWPPETVTRVETLAHSQNVPFQTIWDQAVSIGLQELEGGFTVTGLEQVAIGILKQVHTRHPIIDKWLSRMLENDSFNMSLDEFERSQDAQSLLSNLIAGDLLHTGLPQSDIYNHCVGEWQLIGEGYPLTEDERSRDNLIVRAIVLLASAVVEHRSAPSTSSRLVRELTEYHQAIQTAWAKFAEITKRRTRSSGR